MSDELVMTTPPTHIPNPWQSLRQLTAARIGLGRAGCSLPTQAQLDFQFAHAQARDAVHLALDTQRLATQLQNYGLTSIQVRSRAPERHVYLQRPDWGRRLSEESVHTLNTLQPQVVDKPDVVVMIGDGLSALAIDHHAVPMCLEIKQLCQQENWSLAPIVIASQARVALGDEVGELLHAKMVVVLIGERPGLSSPDSLGIYFTYAPKLGLTDAARNCISNVRLEGLSYATAAYRLAYLMREASKRQLSGVHLKDEADMPVMVGEDKAGLSFLVRL
ncbi:ethanolamine ammonia-lyase subunit EutC [Thiolinea disciformis]|uniref:ethanolamine ammonia-lyase subunit EutC n=1 Tax=Thiolinea disciformis TaxID=125614 RepID=UPI000369C73A|nr:ethanolamine ammonia-lyase subunit EutC [Thiolinea disciformis]